MSSASPLYSNDLLLLNKHFEPVELTNTHGKVIVLPELQGRVMVGAFSLEPQHSLYDQSIGWIHREYLTTKHTNPNQAIGGSTRLWFAPEKGPHAIFFAPEHAQVPENIRVPDAISMDEYEVLAKNNSEVSMRSQAKILSHSNFVFEIEVLRTITLFDETQILQSLEIEALDGIHVVGYQAKTQISNIGADDWSPDTGMLSIWDLSAFAPSDKTTVIMPFKGKLKQPTTYFNDNVPTHFHIANNKLYYRADAKHMNKIGIPIENTLPYLGSYDAVRNLLTIVTFSFNQEDKYYNNSVWFEEGYEPYNGEAINLFNDGPLDDQPPFGPFYELETSSSAKPLKAGASQQHIHRVYHLTGQRKALNKVSLAVLGVNLDTVEAVFK
ncbi:DUF6786 family protein [Agaribacter flavus]|uniref:DUF6786 family protein n=2 Tax=Agaribacter flavus TaxID=1902781 RepID=A0ABV7FMX7_9ALTE